MNASLSEEQLVNWRMLHEDMLRDAREMDHIRELDPRRILVRGELVNFLSSFMNQEIGLDEFKVTFDKKTRTEWEGFGLKGMSGAMFLNMMVKYLPDQASLAQHLRELWRVPSDEMDGRRRMSSFRDYLEDAIKSGSVSRQQIQVARLPYLTSAWWHLQDVEPWPVYYVSARQVFEQEGMFMPTLDPVDDYFAFRTFFLELAAALKMESWPLEHMCAWRHSSRRGEDDQPDPAENIGHETTVNVGEELPEPVEPECSNHTQIQWLLAQLGRKLGCRVWIAANDHNRRWQEDRLGDLSVAELPPLGITPESQKIIRFIDVLWLKGANQVVAAFEVEHTTSVYSGLLRMSDLVASAPNTVFPLYIVVPENRLDRVRRELSRPTFQALELHHRCGFFSDQALITSFEHIFKWANDPSAINQLAEHIPDTGEKLMGTGTT